MKAVGDLCKGDEADDLIRLCGEAQLILGRLHGVDKFTTKLICAGEDPLIGMFIFCFAAELFSTLSALQARRRSWNAEHLVRMAPNCRQ
jgi:hypothetical protein